MTTVDWIVLAIVYIVPFSVAMYGNMLTNRAIENVRKLDAEDNPEPRYQSLCQELERMMKK